MISMLQPWLESDARSNMWYSFNYGPIHIVSIDTETNYPDSANDEHTGLSNGNFTGNQLAWLEQDLAKANASRADVRRSCNSDSCERPCA